MTWAIWLTYLVGYVFTYRKIYPVLCRDLGGDRGDRGFMAIFAMLGSTAWPVVIVGYYFWRLATPTLPEDRAAELAARERRVAELERELGISQYDPSMLRDQ